MPGESRRCSGPVRGGAGGAEEEQSATCRMLWCLSKERTRERWGSQERLLISTLVKGMAIFEMYT